MCGKRSSVVTRIQEISPDVRWTHCNIHREMLVSKPLSDNLKGVLDLSIKIVNYMETKPLQSRRNVKYTDLTYMGGTGLCGPMRIIFGSVI